MSKEIPTIAEMMKALKKIVPKENFRKEPETALGELIALERKHQINTQDLLASGFNHPSLTEEDIYEWINTFETFELFKGDLSLLNSIPSSKDTD